MKITLSDNLVNDDVIGREAKYSISEEFKSELQTMLTEWFECDVEIEFDYCNGMLFKSDVTDNETEEEIYQAIDQLSYSYSQRYSI